MKKPEFLDRYGPWALVAGASRGLGAEYARQLAEKGLNLVLAARSAGHLNDLSEGLARKHSIQTLPLHIDLGDSTAAEQIFDQARGLEIGLLVYNAALSKIGDFLDVPLEEHQREIQVNVATPLALVHRLGRVMRGRGRGGIILMSSLSAMQGSALISNYTATKAYNLLLAEGLWEELRLEGVDVLASCPAAVSTPGYLRSLEENPGRPSTAAMAPAAVVAETLVALGRRPSVIPGFSNRLAAFFMRRVMPRTAAIRLMGSVLRRMYT
jgi:short-subunit dehydrogenase